MANTFNIEQYVAKVVLPAKLDKDGKPVKGAKSSTVYEFLNFVVESKPSRKEAALGRKSTFNNFRVGKNTVSKLTSSFEKYGVGIQKESYVKLQDLSCEELHPGLKLWVKEIQEKNPENPEIFRAILTWLKEDSAAKDSEANPARIILNLFCSMVPFEQLDLSDENRATIFNNYKEAEIQRLAALEKMASTISEEDAIEYSMQVFSKYGVDDKGYLRFKAQSEKTTTATPAPTEEKAEETPALS